MPYNRYITTNRAVITIVTAEDQLRGRLSVISKASDPKSKTSLALAYQNLRLTIESLEEFEQIDFDLEAELIYHQLRQQKIRIGTQDLRIASIALAKYHSIEVDLPIDIFNRSCYTLLAQV